MPSLKERELHLGGLDDGEEGAGLVLLGGERRQHARHSHLGPVPPDLRRNGKFELWLSLTNYVTHLAYVDAVKVPQDILVRDPEHAVVFSVH